MIASHELDPLLDALIWPAAQLVGHVRNRDAQGVAEILGPLDSRGLHALAITLACLVPDDQSIGQLTLWSHAPHVTDEEYEQLAAFDSPPGKKFCKGCGEVLDLQDFYRLKNGTDGRRPRCIACTAEADAERRQRRKAGRDTNPARSARCAPRRREVAAM